MSDITVTLKVVTPMFMGGADNIQAELRPASIKGLLRYWWRAMHGDWPIPKLAEEEAKIFGGAGDKQGQASFAMSVSSSSYVLEPFTARPFSGEAYLGYGLQAVPNQNKPARQAIPSSTEFTVHFYFSKDTNAERDVLNALVCLTYFGGMGARSRRGFGSVVITGVSGATIPMPYLPNRLESLQKDMQQFLQERCIKSPHKRPEYTAFTPEVRCSVLKPRPNYEQALRYVGDRFKEYRSSISQRSLNGVPERVVFGLPSNRINVIGTDRIQRRASPLFIHFHELSDGQVVPVLTLIPADFVPPRAKLKVGNNPKGLDPPSDFGPIASFINSFGGESRKVWPK